MRSRPILAALALVLTAALAPSAASAGLPPTVSLSVELGSCAIQVSGDDLPESLLIKHRSAAGKLKATIPVSTSGPSVGCPGPAVIGGDRLQLFVDAQTTPFRTLVVPSLKLTVDRIDDTLRGTVTGGVNSVSLRVSTCSAAYLGCSSDGLFDAFLQPGTNRFSVDAGEDLTGASRVEMTWSKGIDSVLLGQWAPRLVVEPGRPIVTGTGAKGGQAVTVRVKRGTQVGTGTATTRVNADFKARITRNGSAMKVKAGDVVSADFSTDARMTVPVMTITYDGLTEIASGRCFKNSFLDVVVRDAEGGYVNAARVTSSATGEWEASVGSVSAGWTVSAWCPNARGDVAKVTLLLD